MKTVVAIPTYNESGTIEKIIRTIFEILPRLYVVVIDDNSPDGTQDIVERLMSEFPNLSIMKRKKKEGLGRAYISAILEIIKDSSVDTILTIDADYSHDPKYIPIMLEKRMQYDLVVGSRYIKGGGTEGWELWRRVLSIGGNIYTRIITGIPVHDVTAGLNAISTDLLRKIMIGDMGSSGYAFFIELKYLLFQAGARMCEVPIIFRNRLLGESKISNHIIGEGMKTPWRLIFKKYGK